MSVRRGSTTISLAPARRRFFSLEANTGWPSVGLAPMIITTSVCPTESKSWVPAEVPKAVDSPYPVGEWQTRAQVSTLLLPKPARISFCTTNTSSLVQRDEVMPPTASRPYFPRIPLNFAAAKLKASSHDASRQGSLILSRIIGLRIRSLWLVYPQAKRPLTQEWPRFALPSLYGTMRTTSSPRISAFNEQPTTQ